MPNSVQVVRTHESAQEPRQADLILGILKRLDGESVEQLLANWTAVQVRRAEREAAGNAAEEKEAASPQQAGQKQLPGLDLATGMVVVQLGFTGRKKDAEGAALRKVLDELSPGTCVMADALHTERETARQILDRGLDFLLVVKQNQPTALEQVRDGFHWDCLRSRRTTDCDHGRIETRWVPVSDELEPTVRTWTSPGCASSRRCTGRRPPGRPVASGNPRPSTC